MQMPNTRIHLHSLFGSPIDGRTFSSEKYRFEFNGKEKDNEVKGAGNQQDYGARIYDPRLGRFLSADPLIVYGKEYANLSTYQFASNTPIIAIDLDGLEAKIRIAVQGADGKVSTIKVINWSQAFPGQSHGMFGNTGTINYTLQYQMRTKETRIETINIDYTTVKNGKPVELKATMDFEFRKRTFGEKVTKFEETHTQGNYSNGGGLGGKEDAAAAGTMALAFTGFFTAGTAPAVIGFALAMNNVAKSGNSSGESPIAGAINSATNIEYGESLVNAAGVALSAYNLGKGSYDLITKPKEVFEKGKEVQGAVRWIVGRSTDAPSLGISAHDMKKDLSKSSKK